ncbi:hypothetical protein [Undibacterium sp. CCC3.4]|uniref:hypothetical protein n=1 Tax=Undibacterium sp. CCC3.4 TaxID=3048609 RepID=UPI002AC89740|nr:hypothetical protein [Undibacterium sp. CCC3.4]WPX44697.1 hypothetical protein RHM61_05565 [Undibacterium sp. CCC3.4]
MAGLLVVTTNKLGRLRAHPFAQAAIQWRVRALYIGDICAAQAQQDVFISQKKVPLIDPPTLKALTCHSIAA